MSRIKIFQHPNPSVFYGQIDDATVMDLKANFRIASGHPSGPVLEYYGLKAIISQNDAIALNNICIK